MTKDEYLEKRNEYYKQISEIKESFEKIKEEYINSNCEIPAGRFVYIVTPKVIDCNGVKFTVEQRRKVYLATYEIYLMGEIVPIVYRETEYGTRRRDIVLPSKGEYLFDDISKIYSRIDDKV